MCIIEMAAFGQSKKLSNWYKWMNECFISNLHIQHVVNTSNVILKNIKFKQLGKLTEVYSSNYSLCPNGGELSITF